MLPFLERLGSIPHAVAAVALLLTAAWGAGGLLVDTAVISRRHRQESGLLRIVVGLNLVGFTGMVLGLTGMLVEGRSIWLLFAAVLPAIKSIGHYRQWTMPKFLSGSRWPYFGQSLFGLLVLVTLGPALCYPTGWDEMVYHCVLPRRWLADGYPSVYCDLPYSGFPSFGETLFWLIAPVEALIAPRLVIWVSWILGLLILTRLLHRFGAGRSSLLLTCCFATSPAALMISANCYVESLMMMNIVAIQLAAIHYRRHGGAVLLGILAGGTAATKLTGLVVLALPVIWFVTTTIRSRHHASVALHHAVLSTTVGIVVCLPFYLRPWYWTGNPFYPFLATWFSSSPATLEMSMYHHTIGDLGFGVRSVEALFVTPLLLSVQDQLYDGGFGWQWLLLVAFAGLAVMITVRRRCRSITVWPMSVAVGLYFAWYFTSQQGRFAVPMATSVVCIAATGLRWSSLRLRQMSLCGLIIASIISLPWSTASYYAASWETVAGRWTWAEGLDDATQKRYVPLLDAINQQTATDAKLLLLFEHRLLYLPRSAFVGTPFFQEAWLMPPTEFASEARLMQHIHDGEITHLVIAKSPVGPDWVPEFFERSQPIFRGIEAALQSRQLERIWESEDHLLIVVQPTSPRGN